MEDKHPPGDASRTSKNCAHAYMFSKDQNVFKCELQSFLIGAKSQSKRKTDVEFEAFERNDTRLKSGNV